MRGVSRAWRRVGLAAFAALALAPGAAAAQDLACDPGDLEVRDLDFAGNRAFSDDELAAAVVTTPSSWARRTLRFLGSRRCLDRTELERDVLRLKIFYRRHGFYSTHVEAAERSVGSRSVAVTFRVREGEPVIIDSLAVTGLDDVADRSRIVRGLELEEGRRFDRYWLASARETMLRRLRNGGYPRADILPSYTVDTVSNVAEVELAVLTGSLARIDTIRVEVQPAEGRGQQITDATVRRLLGFGPGEPYRERDLITAQRNLYQLDAYRHVEVTLAPDSVQPAADSLIAIDVSLIEGHMHAAKLGVGWATLDCFRTQGEYIDRNFLGGGRRLEVSARLSKIGIADGVRFAEGICQDLAADPFSDQVNYYAGVTFRQPTLLGLGPRSIPSITLYSERRSEFKVYERTTYFGGIASLTREPLASLPLTLSYQLEYGRTTAQPALFCAVFAVCVDRDRRQLGETQRIAVVGASLVRDRTDNPFNPSRGTLLRLEFRHASPTVGSSPQLRFNKWLADGAWYSRIGDGAVFAARLRLGGVLEAVLADEGELQQYVPPQERLYAGGPNTVRGFRQNELGPVVYVVDEFRPDTQPNGTIYYRTDTSIVNDLRAVPTGGTALAVANLELRMRSPVLPNLLQWTVFTDAGQVWDRNLGESEFDLSRIRWTPGAGVRVFTPIGALRVDVGYNRYAQRPGAAYYDAPPTEEGNAPLYCVSPNNTRPIVPGQEPGDPPVQLGEGCPASFVPNTDDRFLRRLTFNFSIGQAF